MAKLFGTDGVRGVANRYPMDVETTVRLGRAVSHIFKNRKNTSPRTKILIGKDTRLSGYMFETALAAGVCSMGADAILVGPLPTPGIAFLTTGMRADAGAVISASHNPFHDNGIKFFGRDGYKLPDHLEAKIEELVLGKKLDNFLPSAKNIGRAKRIKGATGRYSVYVKTTFSSDLTLDGIRIVVDCANGAAYKVAPEVFWELGAEVIPIGVAPDGFSINDGCGALHPQAMCQTVRQYRADIGIALDGDGDRVIFSDEHGVVVDGDEVMAVCATRMIREGTLAKNTLVTTVMSNLGLDLAIQAAGGTAVKTPVGDRHVVAEMRKHGYNFGGEQSGHLIFSDYSTTGDGIVSALQILAIMVREGTKLGELKTVMKPMPQRLINVPVQSKPELSTLKGVQKALQAAEQKLGQAGRVLVRYSGTEPRLRVMVEGEDERVIEGLAQNIAEEAMREIGA